MVVYRKLPFCADPQPKQKVKITYVAAKWTVVIQASNVVWMEAHAIPLQVAKLSKHFVSLLLFTLIP